jgi:tRNA(fMet)-specific endonuclease VapC
VEEQCRGWLAQIHRARDVHRQIPAYEHFRLLFQFFRKWQIAPFETDAADKFDQMRKQKTRIGSQDLKIALTRDAMLLSANLHDFRHVPDLRVENWLAG